MGRLSVPVADSREFASIRGSKPLAARWGIFGSFHQLWHPRRRWPFFVPGTALEAAGGLDDTPKGRRLYRDYLIWLSDNREERKRLDFERMSRGWAKGKKDFKKAVLEDLNDEVALRVVESEAAELREPRWERAASNLLELLGRSEEDLASHRIGAPCKVAIARVLRERYLVPNRWIAERLHMGRVSTVQSLVSRHRSGLVEDKGQWEKLNNHETLG